MLLIDRKRCLSSIYDFSSSQPELNRSYVKKNKSNQLCNKLLKRKRKCETCEIHEPRESSFNQIQPHLKKNVTSIHHSNQFNPINHAKRKMEIPSTPYSQSKLIKCTDGISEIAPFEWDSPHNTYEYHPMKLMFL